MLGQLPRHEPCDAYWTDRIEPTPSVRLLNEIAQRLGASERVKDLPVVRALRESRPLDALPVELDPLPKNGGVLCTFCRLTRVPPGRAQYASTCTRCVYCPWCDAYLRARCGGEYACATRAIGTTVNGTEPPCGVRKARLQRLAADRAGD